MTTVMQELAEVTKVSRKPGEPVQPFLTRLYKKAAAIPDTEWRKLDDTTQTWINSAGDALEAKNKLAAPEGFEDLEEIDEGEETDASPEVEAEVEAVLPRRKVTAKAAKAPKEAKVAKVKPVKAAKAAKPKAAKGLDLSEKPARVAKVKGGNGVKKAAKANGQTNGRGRPAAYAPDAKIHLLVKENPHRAGSGRFKRWARYKNGMTVKEALNAGFNTRNLYYSATDGHIRIG